ncbi:Tad domain-containing protein [Vibrio sp. J1-1]|uniref:Tad domain-containing protein n=1 Tax=Vibrio sp. J1-1 TaxID=2912251 RepID=UPI001F1F45A9|nr:Tad domain-containing protein [Vibrio sp. J1-1]MCF7481306.1 Tad domain-containing protein [Vibrio sp. J1-1]
MSSRNPIRPKRSQQGITLVLISVIMLILIGMGAFAIDLNHQVLNKARLQNAVDSAALASAVVADDAEDASLVVELAETAAIDALKSFAESMGNQELAAEEEGMAGDISITFSNTKEKGSFLPADEFTPDSDGDIYVRVAVSDISLTQFLSRIFGVGKSVSASAVAGPSAPINRTCNISPIGMCATTTSTDLAWGYIPADNPNYDAENDKDADTVHVLKPPSHKESGIGAGNYNLLDFGQGKDTVNELLAGNSSTCITVGQSIWTEPGVGAGPVAKGLNTRFDGDDPIVVEGEVEGEVETIPINPDKYLEESNVTYENYKTEYEQAEIADNNGEDPGNTAFYYADYYNSLQSCEGMGGERACKPEYYEQSGEEGRRVLRVPIIDCDSTTKSGGKMEVKVLGLGCFFVTQRVDIGNSIIFGQFLENCTVQNASTGIDPSTEKIGPYKIQLYKDPESGES